MARTADHVHRIGASLLCGGWFGFNADEPRSQWRAALAMTNSFVATRRRRCHGFREWIIKGHPSVLRAISGAVADCRGHARGGFPVRWSDRARLVVGVVCFF